MLKPLIFWFNELKDPILPVIIRRVILASLTKIDSAKSIPYLVEALGFADISIREAAANFDRTDRCKISDCSPFPLFKRCLGRRLRPPLARPLNSPAAVRAPIEEYTRTAVSHAVMYDTLMRGVKSETHAQREATSLLVTHCKKSQTSMPFGRPRHWLVGKSRVDEFAIEIFEKPQCCPTCKCDRSYGILNTRSRTIIQPVMRIWEEESAPQGKADWGRLIADEDLWIRDSALFAAHKLGEIKMENIANSLLMERILFFERVPLFANLIQWTSNK